MIEPDVRFEGTVGQWRRTALALDLILLGSILHLDYLWRREFIETFLRPDLLGLRLLTGPLE